MKKATLIILTLFFATTLFAQKIVKKHIKYTETVNIGDSVSIKKSKPKKAAELPPSADSIKVSVAEFKSILGNYFQKVDKSAIADKIQIEQNAASEKKAIIDYYNHLFPEQKPATPDSTKIKRKKQ